MCVDDYQFKCYEAKREKVCRRFVITNEHEITHTYYVNISQFQQEGGQLALCKILIYFSKKGLIIDGKKFYIPKFNSIIEPYTFCKVRFEALDDVQVIMKTYLKDKNDQEIFQQNQEIANVSPVPLTKAGSFQLQFYSRFQDVQQSMDFSNIFLCTQPYQKHTNSTYCENMSNEDSQQQKNKEQNSSEHLHQKRTREPQRIISEVIILVKIWRQLHQIKKWSLIAAAKLVGISKKSLDDYFLVLRIGQIHGYDYQANLNQGMGELRSYIRNKQQKVTGKLTKVVQSFKLVPAIDLDLIITRFANGEKLQLT